LYVAALRSGPPRLARVAAIGLGEIGDPRGDSVPYLINALVSYGTVATMKQPAQTGVLYTVTVYATPGLKVSDPNLAYASQSQGTNTIPVALGGASTANNPSPAAPNNAAGSGQPLQGGQAAQDLSPNSQGMPNVQLGSSGTVAMTQIATDVYEQPAVVKTGCKHDRPLSGEIDHPEVLDALLKITDQPHPGFGFNRDRWRTWWATEKTNRDLQRPAASDRVVSSGSTAH
jgi:hypothetical protein